MSDVKVILFGATGMVGQGVLRECLLAPDVTDVLAIGRAASGQRHPKLREIVHPDLLDLEPIAAELTGYDACFFCLGVSAVGMSEADYRRVTYDITLAAARTLAVGDRDSGRDVTFIYVSGRGTDSTGQGRSTWARVKGETENALLDLPLQVYLFRPGFIQPLHGISSRTRFYRIGYRLAGPFLPLARRLSPGSVTTTEQVGLAMLRVARGGAPKRVLENQDINALS